MRFGCEKPNAEEKVRALRRSIHRIGRQIDQFHRGCPNPHLEREAEILEAIVEDIRGEVHT